MKKKWTAAVFAALMLAVSFTAMTACKKEEAPPAEAPDGIGVTVDGVYECDIFDAWDTRVLIVNEDGQRVYIGSGYMNGEGLGATIKVTNYSRESEVAPFPGVAERNSLKYEWKPLGMSYYEWLEALGKASDQAAIDALCVEDYVSLIAYRDGVRSARRRRELRPFLRGVQRRSGPHADRLQGVPARRRQLSGDRRGMARGPHRNVRRYAPRSDRTASRLKFHLRKAPRRGLFALRA